jgi:alpha-D-ribose 1-methylphosphonate 5-triphosphate synthase subunit PhnG
MNMDNRTQMSAATAKTDSATAARQTWMAVLARAETAELEAAWAALADKPAYRLLRKPETGLVMARGQIGGGGGPFNLGEISVTRCAAQLAGGPTGFGYVAGRDARKCELAALFDGMLQDDARRDGLLAGVIAPLQEAQARRQAATRADAARTRVNFFALERGEDAR